VAAPLLSPMPEALVVDSGYTLRVTALDPTTGAQVAGVNIGMEVITGTSNEPSSFPDIGDPILIGVSP
jgi:hypothetical protein